jgi:hypothetical protein
MIKRSCQQNKHVVSAKLYNIQHKPFSFSNKLKKSLKHLMDEWNILQEENNRGMLQLVSGFDRKVSSEVFGRKQSWAPGARRICDG